MEITPQMIMDYYMKNGKQNEQEKIDVATASVEDIFCNPKFNIL